jgi:murein L,D-transpeptidase YafK/tricorn protease-like protein
MVRGVRLLVRLGLAIAILSGAMAGHLTADTNSVIGLFLGYSRAVNTIALSANGRQALSGGQDNVLRLWDIPTGLLLRTFDAQASRINAVAFSPDGHLILSGGSDKLVRIWAVSTGQAVRTIEGHAGEVLSVAISPDGKRALSGSADKTVKLWDVETGDLIRTFEGHSDEVLSVAFSSDGQKALSASKDKTLKLWDVETGQLLMTLEGHADAVTSAALSADGAVALSGSKDKTIKLWDLASGQPVKTFVGHSDEVLSVVLSSDGRVLSAGKDKTLKLWNAKTGELIKTFEGHSDSVTSVGFSADGQNAFSGSWDKTLKLWHLKTGQLQNTIDVQSITFWPSGYRNFFSGVSATKRADPAQVEERLKEMGLKRGAPVFLRIFKGDLEVELWMKRGDRYDLFATYPICAWSGQLGPKVREGDLQAPEGFYTIGKGQLNPNSKYHRAFNLGYPNALDRAHNRTGANLMVHGACASVGCIAITDAAIDELWLLVTAALDSGQERVPVHVFPFRMTDERLAAFAWHPWADFWRDMKPAYDLFEERHVPPQVSVCNKRYSVQGRTAGGWTPVSQSECPSRRGGSLPLP